MNCEHCNAELRVGVDIVGKQPGVVGTRGFVALGPMDFYCSEQCLHADADEAPSMPRRIP